MKNKMIKRSIKQLSCILLAFGLFQTIWCTDNPDKQGPKRIYSIVSRVNVREKPSLKSKLISRLRHGRWVRVSGKEDKWTKVQLPNGKTGYIFDKLITDTWIKVLKDERQLLLMKGNSILKQYPAALGFNPKNDKIRQGDGCTPEGRFYICEIREKPKPPETYGPVSLRISYPNIEDARRGLKNKLINKARYRAIVKAVHQGKMPPQNTTLGGSIKIHGGEPGVSGDWTLGCIALRSSDIKNLYNLIPHRLVMVEVYRNKQQEKSYNGDGFVNRRILAEAKKLMKKGCKYTRRAISIIPISYPMGDFDSSIGVCTDVAIRALRGINIDLQALLYEDILINPTRYRGISRPNPNIDHRRTRNLKIFFDHHAAVLTNETPLKKPNQWRAGDIVLMDTGIRNGTIYDHIGIVGSRKNSRGIPLVINLWTVGWKLNEMELLNGDYPDIVGHYRLHHPFYYGALF
jgi:uncharacterized protein YijF (DUF1287 family)